MYTNNANIKTVKVAYLNENPDQTGRIRIYGTVNKNQILFFKKHFGELVSFSVKNPRAKVKVYQNPTFKMKNVDNPELIIKWLMKHLFDEGYEMWTVDPDGNKELTCKELEKIADELETLYR